MVADVKVNINTVQVRKFLNKFSKDQRRVIQKSLNRVSNMAILMITKRTQKGNLPDGGKMLPYAKSTKKNRSKRGRQTGFVDLTDSGKMFRSLDYRKKGFRNTLLFTNMERAKIASFHDSFGVGKKRVKRPFFAIGRNEEDKIVDEFTKFYASELKI